MKLNDRTQEIKAARGVFEIGETTLEGCGEFVFTDTIDNEGWTIEASVKIGTETIPNAKIAFSFDETFTVPTAQFDKFKDKTDATLPEFSIEFKNKAFALKKENLQDYRDEKHEVLTVLVKPENRDSFLLGKNFLTDYCIALKAKDDAVTKFEVGLAPIVSLGTDPQWENYVDDRDGKNGNGVKHTYQGETPIINLQYKNTGTSIPISKGLLTLEESFTFVLAKACQAKDSCTTYQHNNVFDTSTGTDRKKPVSIPYKGSTLTGSTYQGLLVAGNINGNEDFDVITGVTGSAVDLEQDAVLGLSFGDSLSTGFPINKFLSNAPNGKKSIIFRRGPFRQQLKYKEFKSPSGSFVIGENTLEGCGPFIYRDTIDKAGWSIKATVKIGEVQLDEQTISFSFDKLFTVPTRVFGQFEDKTDETLPDVTIEFEGQTFELNAENLQDYRDEKHKVLTLLVEHEDREGFLLGKNFLRDYCIALRAKDDALTGFQVGLAPFLRRRSDPEWESYPAPLKFDYYGESPLIDVQFAKTGSSIPISKALLTLDETFTFFLSEGCKAKDSCTTFDHVNVYNPT
uniref:Peptidase A1 domain-containing protein n=1 Tax=Bursaphelenchus xylophilus TaxID=6326 RepID=A0A1I7S5C1_BURXY